jgi:hypothetical protein
MLNCGLIQAHTLPMKVCTACSYPPGVSDGLHFPCHEPDACCRVIPLRLAQRAFVLSFDRVVDGCSFGCAPVGISSTIMTHPNIST